MNDLSPASALAILETLEVDLGPARRGRRVAAPLAVEVVRALGSDDLPALCQPPALGTSLPALTRVRNSHHELARHLAKGEAHEYVSQLTGYSPAYISNLLRDPTFAELLAYYETQRELVFVDVLERMKGLGLSFVDEIQSRLEEAPEKFSTREMGELVKLLLVDPMNAKAAGHQPPAGGQGNGVSVNVTFVQANHADAPTLDITPNKE